MVISVVFRNFKVKKIKQKEKQRMITESEVIEFFCLADEFCQLFNNDKEIFCQSVQVNRKYNHEAGMNAAE